jgi:hypothetical protein
MMLVEHDDELERLLSQTHDNVGLAFDTVFQMQMADTVTIFFQHARDIDPGDEGVSGIKRQPDVGVLS